MSRISSCAACHGDILIPGAAQPLDVMRCPLCQAQFQVQQVLAGSILAPPEAIPLGQQAAGILPSVSVGTPQPHATSPVQWDADVATATPRPRKKQPGLVSHFIGIVGGGIIGLSLGYLGLLRFGGPQYDFLKIEKQLPKWVTAPIPLFQVKQDDKEARNGRGLQDLLNEPDAPPVELPVAPPAGVTTPSGQAPPFNPPAADPVRQDAPPADAAPTNPFLSTAEPPPLGAYMPEPSAPPPEITPGDQPAPPPPVPATPPPSAALPSSAPFTPTSLQAAPAAAPRAPPPEQGAQLGPRQFTPYSGEDLSLAVAEVTAALRCPVCNGAGFTTRTVVTGTREVRGGKTPQNGERRLACDACGGKPIAKITPEVYAKLCHLAEVVTFVTKESDDSWNQREAVQNLALTATTDQRAAEAIGRLAGFQLDQSTQKTRGIVLAGTVQELTQIGNLFAMRIVLFGLPKVVTVVSWRPAQPAINEHDRVVILGSVVDNPTENLAGYEGQLPQVVWGGLPVKLPPQP